MRGSGRQRVGQETSHRGIWNPKEGSDGCAALTTLPPLSLQSPPRSRHREVLGPGQPRDDGGGRRGRGITRRTEPRKTLATLVRAGTRSHQVLPTPNEGWRRASLGGVVWGPVCTATPTIPSSPRRSSWPLRSEPGSISVHRVCSAIASWCRCSLSSGLALFPTPRRPV